MPKTWLSVEEQAARLRDRGLGIDDEHECLRFLSHVSYYRFSGYFRYWQRSPETGDNRFISGTAFSTIHDVYTTEQAVAASSFATMRWIEILLRTAFAHHYAQHVAPLGALAHDTGVAEPRDPAAPRVEDRVLRDLDRSQEAYIAHYRDESCKNLQGQYLPTAYDTLPVWVAVEALSFGTLSKCIQACEGSRVLEDMACALGVARAPLVSQVRSMVYLRNRLAHHARIWNHSVLDAPSVPMNVKRRAKKSYGALEPRSVFAIFVAMDRLLTTSGLTSSWLSLEIFPLLTANPLAARGLMAPRKYGDMDLSLTGSSSPEL